MPLPTDPQLTKLRLLAERARRDAERAAETARQQGRLADVAWLAFVRRCEYLGYCANCEKPKSECRCVLLASV